jgi:hypothetical protein
MAKPHNSDNNNNNNNKWISLYDIEPFTTIFKKQKLFRQAYFYSKLMYDYAQLVIYDSSNINNNDGLFSNINDDIINNNKHEIIDILHHMSSIPSISKSLFGWLMTYVRQQKLPSRTISYIVNDRLLLPVCVEYINNPSFTHKIPTYDSAVPTYKQFSILLQLLPSAYQVTRRLYATL